MPSSMRIFAARRILTMDPNRPTATHVAVRDGRILGVGTGEALAGWGVHELDMSLADKVLMPGLVEGHSHVLEGWVWNHAYLGSYDRRAPDGVVWDGVTCIDGVVERLAAFAERQPDRERILTGWGFDPLFVERRLTAADLDRVSSDRPVVVYHASFHIVVVNSLVLRRGGIGDETNSEFVLRDDSGRVTGELAGQIGRYLMAKALGGSSDLPPASAADVRRFAESAKAAGVTTVTDLHNELPEEMVAIYRTITAAEDFPVRIVPALRGNAAREGAVEYLRHLTTLNTAKLRFGPVKFVADGSNRASRPASNGRATTTAVPMGCGTSRRTSCGSA